MPAPPVWKIARFLMVENDAKVVLTTSPYLLQYLDAGNHTSASFNENSTPDSISVGGSMNGQNYVLDSGMSPNHTWTYNLKSGYKLKVERNYVGGGARVQASILDSNNVVKNNFGTIGTCNDNWTNQAVNIGFIYAENYPVVYFCSMHKTYRTDSQKNFADLTIWGANNVYDYLVRSLPTAPYDNGGNTDTGGGDGDFEDPDDPRPVPSLPSINLCDSGLLTVYSLTSAQVKDFGQYLWSAAFDEASFKKLFDNPMECIVSLGILPGFVTVTSTNIDLYIGNTDTGLDVKGVEDQFYEVDMGFVELPEYWGAYLDYNPFTKLKMVVPYCGEVDLNPDDVMGKYVGLIYHIDVITGCCTAYITAGEGPGVGKRNDVFYTTTGNMLLTIPLCATDYKQAFSGLLNYAKSVVTGIVGGAMAGGAAGAAIGAAAGTASGIASNITNMKTNYNKTGAMGSSFGVLGEQTPYIYIDRPRQALPADQNQFTGYPSYITSQLSDLSGYTEMIEIHLEGIPATRAELDEIESLLKGGVYL